MDTRQLIVLVLKFGWGLLVRGGIVYSFFVGVRYGFRFPRLLHFFAVAIVVLEVGILFLFPVPWEGFTMLTTSILVLFPLSPYIGWVFAGGPVSRR